MGEQGEGFRWVGSEALSSPDKFSDNHIHESTLVSHSSVCRRDGGFLTIKNLTTDGYTAAEHNQVGTSESTVTLNEQAYSFARSSAIDAVALLYLENPESLPRNFEVAGLGTSSRSDRGSIRSPWIPKICTCAKNLLAGLKTPGNS